MVARNIVRNISRKIFRNITRFLMYQTFGKSVRRTNYATQIGSWQKTFSIKPTSYIFPCVLQKETAHVDTKELNRCHQSQNDFCGIFVGIQNIKKVTSSTHLVHGKQFLHTVLYLTKIIIVCQHTRQIRIQIHLQCDQKCCILHMLNNLMKKLLTL